MSDFNENTRIINAENQEHLIEARDAEIEKVEKLSFLINLLKNADLKQIDIPNKEAIRKAIKALTFQNYLQLDETSCALNLHECKSLSLTYTERKAIRNYLISKLSESCDPIVAFARKIKEEIPEVFRLADKNQEFLELEMKRRELQQKLAEIKSRKCAMLKLVADIKTGSYLKNELEIMLAEHKLNQMKTSVFQSYVLSILFSPKYSQTEQPVTHKAIKEIEAHINAELEEE